MSSPLTDAERIRAILDHLEIRFDERLKAILALQGLVFAALGFSWGKIVGMPLLLSIVGILATAALIGEAERTQAAAAKIISWWRQHSAPYEGPPILEERFEMGRKLLNRSPAALLSYTLGVGWGAIVILSLVQLLREFRAA